MVLDVDMMRAIRAGRVIQKRKVTGPAGGPYADYYTHYDRIDGRPLTASERSCLRRLCSALGVSPPRLPNGPGQGPYVVREL